MLCAKATTEALAVADRMVAQESFDPVRIRDTKNPVTAQFLSQFIQLLKDGKMDQQHVTLYSLTGHRKVIQFYLKDTPT